MPFSGSPTKARPERRRPVFSTRTIGPGADHATPAYSPESNGPAEAFVHTFKRDYVNGAEPRDAEIVLAQLGEWLEAHNRQAPRSALGMGDARTHAPICLAKWGADQRRPSRHASEH